MKAIGIVRVSQTKGRDGESFVSPSEQRQRIEAECERRGLTLIRTLDELDVSGGTPLDRRPGLRSAIEAIESGEAKVVVGAYFDRLIRSLDVQRQLVQRVEAAGGQVLAVDVGRVSEGTASQWMSGTILGAVAEYHRRTTAERTGEAQRDAVARGVVPFPRISPGYMRGPDGRLVPHPSEAPIVAEAFHMRAGGASIKEVRAYLSEHGISRTYHGTQALLRSKLVLGRIEFGELVNERAHEPIVDDVTWQRVQRMKLTRGRRAKSDRLLARLGVLRCGSCGQLMMVGAVNMPGRARFPIYRCSPTGDCQRRMTIGADIVEGQVSEYVRAFLADADGRASAESHARDAVEARDAAQAKLDAAIRAFASAGIDSEPTAIEQLRELTTARDEAQAAVDQVCGTEAAVTLNLARDWDKLTPDEQRTAIRAAIERVTITPGRGAERVTITPWGAVEQLAA